MIVKNEPYGKAAQMVLMLITATALSLLRVQKGSPPCLPL